MGVFARILLAHDHHNTIEENTLTIFYTVKVIPHSDTTSRYNDEGLRGDQILDPPNAVNNPGFRGGRVLPDGSRSPTSC